MYTCNAAEFVHKFDHVLNGPGISDPKFYYVSSKECVLAKNWLLHKSQTFALTQLLTSGMS